MHKKNAWSPYFSIAIATYNRPQLLKRAIESVSKQSFRDFEVIVVDDSLKGNSNKVVAGYPWVKYYKLKRNRGQAFAKNFAIVKAKGKFITFLDDDDYYLKNHLETRAVLLKRHPSVKIIHGGFKVLGSPYVPDKNNPSKLIHIRKCVLGPTLVVDRKVFKAVGKFKLIKYAEDSEWYERAKLAGVSVLQTKKQTYVYDRKHNKNSITKSQELFWAKP